MPGLEMEVHRQQNAGGQRDQNRRDQKRPDPTLGNLGHATDPSGEKLPGPILAWNSIFEAGREGKQRVTFLSVARHFPATCC
jgi:hypothetical protein